MGVSEGSDDFSGMRVVTRCEQRRPPTFSPLRLAMPHAGPLRLLIEGVRAAVSGVLRARPACEYTGTSCWRDRPPPPLGGGSHGEGGAVVPRRLYPPAPHGAAPGGRDRCRMRSAPCQPRSSASTAAPMDPPCAAAQPAVAPTHGVQPPGRTFSRAGPATPPAHCRWPCARSVGSRRWGAACSRKRSRFGLRRGFEPDPGTKSGSRFLPECGPCLRPGAPVLGWSRRT
jgi:hypothetical protein